MTKEVVIEKISKQDAEVVLKWENDPAYWDISDNTSPYSLEDIEYLIASMKDIRKAKQMRWMIKRNNEPLGAVDLFNIDFDKKTGEVGILIYPKKERRKGIASLALKQLEEEASQLRIEKLKSIVFETNEPAQRLFFKLDYKKTGEGEFNHRKIIMFEKCLKS